MKTRKSFAAILVTGLVLTLVGSALPAPAFAQCSIPLAPGSYQGTYTQTITFTPNQYYGSGTQWNYTGNMNLTVNCDGTVTGSMILNQNNTSVVAGGGAGTCTGAYPLNIIRGAVAAGNGGFPTFTLVAATTAEVTETCLGDVPAPIASSTAPAGFQFTFTFTASSSNPVVRGTDMRVKADTIDRILGILGRLNIQPIYSAQWQLTGGATATPEPDAPEITDFSARYRQIFLQGVRSVPNEFTAAVNWKNGPPGSVIFTLSGPASDRLETTAAPYKYPQEMGDLASGSYTLSAVAVNGLGKPSPAREISFNIVPVPGWAADITWTVQPKDGYVLYLGVSRYPTQPYSKSFMVPDSIPYLGGPWGLQATQFNFNLAVSSLGSQADSKVNGFGNFGLGKSRVYNLTLGGDTTTQLDTAQLNFVKGQASVRFDPDFFADDSIDLARYLPGLQLLRGFWGTKWLVSDVITARASIRVGLNGTGDLGIVEDQLKFTRGQGTALPDVQIVPLRIGKDWANVSVGGMGYGSVTFGLYPEVRLTSCFLEFRLFARYTIYDRGGDASTEPLLYVCALASQPSLATSRGLYALAQQAPLRVIARPNAWQPEQAVNHTTRSNGVATTVLVEHAKVNAGPDLAGGPDGQMAFVWVAEDSARPRQQANEIRLRLFDGQTWGDPIAITNDTRPDFDPHAAFDKNGQLVIAWTENRIEDLAAESPLDERFLQHLEVAYAVVNPATREIITQGRLTEDGLLDFDLHLVAGSDGSIWAVWQNGEATASTYQLRAALWDGRQWSAVETIADQPIDGLGWSVAAFSRDDLFVTLESDSDGNPATTADREVVVIRRTRSGWDSPLQITHNTAPDLSPRAAYTSDGRPAVAWYSEGQIFGLLGDLSAEAVAWMAVTPDTAATFSSGTFVARNNGEMALLWPGTTADGPSVLISKYDPGARAWNGPSPVFDDDLYRTDLSLVLQPGGAIALSYAQPALTFERMTGGDGRLIEVPGVPETASLAVAEVPGVFSPETADAAPSRTGWLLLLLVAAGLAGLALIAIVAVGAAAFRRGAGR